MRGLTAGFPVTKGNVEDTQTPYSGDEAIQSRVLYGVDEMIAERSYR